MKLQIVCITVLLALVLSACGAAATAPETPAASTDVQPASAAAQPASAQAPAQASASAAVATAPTPTFEIVVDAEPSGAASSAAPAAAGGAVGNSSWRDQVLRSDALLVAVENLPATENGDVYSAWLAGGDKSLPLGTLTVAGNGPATLTYISPGHENLVGAYDRVYVGKGTAADASAALGEVVLAGELPQQALVHVRHVLFSIGITPAKLGFALGLRQETDELLRHAQFLQEAYDANDLALEKVHAEHIINIISGAQAEGFGDLNGDGKAQNPGDGYGLLPNGQQEGYIKGMIDHARLAAESPDATDNIKLHAGHVQIAGDNTTARIQQVQDAARRVLQAPGVAESQADVLQIVALSQQAIQGIDLNNDEQIAPVPGEGGVLTAYQHAQLMAGIELSAEAAATVSAPPPAVAPAAAPTQQLAIDIVDNSFTAAKITVPVGASVVWANTGQKKHSVTADDGSFDSGELTNGASFAHTFAAPGTYQYFCTFHGGAGGQGMSATIVVVDAAATQAAAQPPAPAAASAAPSDHGHASPAAQQSTPPAASAAASQAAPAAPAPAAETVDVAIGDNTFTQKEISVALGATINWSHTGQRPHTVTADDGSFNSDTLQNGGAFEQTFSAPGIYAYYCEFHGGPGGVGMSGVIRVEDR